MKTKIEESNLGDEEIVSLLRDFMGEFKDTQEEIRVALANAREQGFILEAKKGDDIVGLAVVMKLPYAPLFPNYHLTYVATRSENRREGIGNMLVGKSLELAGGDMSLHVSPRNDKAISLYKKAGLKESYVRMMGTA